MKWKKLGKIFDPRDHALLNNCREFAQSPQALVCDTFIRVYFSTRERDAVGKYLSQVAFVDFNKKFDKIFNVSNKTVIALGGLGCFDEHGIFPVNVLRDGDKILAYTTGWTRRVSVSVDSAIGYAVSTDGGVTFDKVGDGPVVATSLHEPFLVGDAFVVKYGSVYYMWYIHGVRWIRYNHGDPAERVYKITYATSRDAISWEKSHRHIVPNKLNDDECQALPTVIKHNDTYHMFFCYRYAADFRKSKDKSYRIGYAFSRDLMTWTRDDDATGIDLSPDGWDSEMQCYPHVFSDNNNIYMLYNGNEFGRYGFGLAVLES